MRNLTERLRPIWEHTDEEVVDQSGAINVKYWDFEEFPASIM